MRNRTPARAALSCAWVALLAGACNGSGQTGSADCAGGGVSCVCASLAGRIAMAADVLGFDGRQIDLRITADRPSHPPNLAPAVGNRVVGPILGTLPCGETAAPSYHAGDHVVVLVGAVNFLCAPDPICDAGGADAWAVSTPESEEWRASDLIVVASADHVDFGDGTLVPRDSLPSLSDPSACSNAYPGPPAPPCDDTPSGWKCSASASAPTSISGAGAVWFGLVVLGGVARLRRSNTRARQ